MDAKLVRLVRAVLKETHQEHLAHTIAVRIVRAVRRFHNRPENFAQDSKDATYSIDCVFEDVLELQQLYGLRKLLSVIVHFTDGTQANAVMATSPVDYFKGNPNKQAFAYRIGSKLKLKGTKQMMAATVIYNAPPQISEDQFDTWLTESQLDFAVNEEIGTTMTVIGDDAASLFLRRAEQDLEDLVASLDLAS